LVRWTHVAIERFESVRNSAKLIPKEDFQVNASHVTGGIFAASLVMVSTFLALPVASQDGPSAAKPCIGCSVDGKTTPRTADGHPDLSGLWNNHNSNNLYSRSDDGSLLFDFGGVNRPAPAAGAPAPAPLSEPSYKPEYMAKVQAINDAAYGSTTSADPQYDCKPMGIPRSMATRDSEYSAFQIVQTPQLITILFESSPYSTYRVIYLDGRQHPQDLDTSYLGHSIGHWEGDALVVDVVGLNDETWLGGGFTGLKNAKIHSDKEHVVERITRTGDVLTYEATVEDPIMFTKPWVITPKQVRHAGPDDEILETTCEVVDKSHIVKPTQEDHFICNYCVPDKTKK
jgi:hypothetical protein